MKVKRTTTNELIEDNTIDAEMLCEWEGNDIKIVIDPTPTLASKHFLSNLKVGENVLVKGKLVVTAHSRRMRRAGEPLPLILKEARIMYGESKFKKFQTDPARDLIKDPVAFFRDLANRARSASHGTPPVTLQETSHQVSTPVIPSTNATPTSSGFSSSAGAPRGEPNQWSSGCCFLFDGRGRQIFPGGRLVNPQAGDQMFMFDQYFEDGRRRVIAIRNMIQQQEGTDTLVVEEKWLEDMRFAVALEGDMMVDPLVNEEQ
ncbi:hypothetical protein BGX34_002530 [Mortierella sp. NVP85]|nr:hypothetical protein BGX34_002530 [Mortierella sp. NVP85]